MLFFYKKLERRNWIGGEAVKHHLLPLTGYFLLTMLYTWPVIPCFFTHIPGGGDAPWFLWQFWWFKYALLDLRQSPYVTNLIYYPLQDVPVMAQTPVNELFSLPIQVAFNVVILNNVLFVLTYLLSGYFTYLLGVALTKRRTVAFIGGLIFAFCTYRGIRSLGHLSLLTTQWMPLALLLIIQCGRRPTWQRGAAAGLVAGLVALSSPYYIGLFLFPVVLVGAIYLLLWGRPFLRQKALWWAALVGGVTFLAFTLPPYFHYAQLEAEIYTMLDVLQRDAVTYSADLLAWWLPSGKHPLWQAFTAPFYAGFTTPNLMETTVFVGYLPLLLLFVSFGLRRRASTLRFWQLLAIWSWLLALGPVLHVNGKAYFGWLPYHFLAALPGYSSLRIPSRAGITTALALSVLAMLVISWLMTRYRQAPWRLLLPMSALLIFFNNLVVSPFILTDIRIPAIYQEIAADPAATAILELPAGEYFQQNFNFFGEVSQAMYYQSYHQKPIISGYLGRRPARLAEPEHTLPFIRNFFRDEADQPQAGFATRPLLPEPFRSEELEQAPWLLQHLGIGHVILRRVVKGQLYLPAAPLLNQALGLPVQIAGDHRLYRVQPPPYQLHNVPLSPLVAIMPTYDEAFAPSFRDEQGAATRAVLADGAIRFTLPFTGVWSIQGEWVGAAADGVQVQFNGAPLGERHDRYAQEKVAWQATITAPPGRQLLTLSLPPLAQSATNGPCTTLCLRDFTVRLVQPRITTTAPLATFVNATNQQATLLTTTLLATAETTAPALQTAWLVTVWQLDAETFAHLQKEPQAAPVLYLHLTTADGEKRVQADHRLGERRLVLTDAPILFDLTPVTVERAAWTTLQVRLGLWYPEQNSYFWATDATQVDEGNRFKLGTLAHYQQPVDAPAITIDPQMQSVFTLPTAEEAFILLQARLLPPTKPAAAPTLLTTWRTPYNFSSESQIKLRLLVTDASGVVHAEVEHILGADNLLNLAAPYLIDRTTLPNPAESWADMVFWVSLVHGETNQSLTVKPAQPQQPADRVRLGTWRELADERQP